MSLETAQAKFKFNTCITPLGERTGEFSEPEHKRLTESFRTRAAQLDGLDQLKTQRFGMVVSYRPWITDPEAIRAHMQGIIDELVRDPDCKMFPFRGDQPVTVEIVKPPAASPTTLRTICVNLPTDLYPVRTTDIDAVKQYVGARVAHFDGARGYGISQRRVRVLFDSALTDNEPVLDHVRQAFAELRKPESGPAPMMGIELFPYLDKEAALELSHEFRDGHHIG